MLSNFQQSILNSESPGTWNVKLGNKLHEMHEHMTDEEIHVSDSQAITDHMNNGSMHSNPTNFVIAPSNAINKERADLVLTGVPADDLAAINNAITMLHTMRESTDVAIRIDFLGGNIDVGTKLDDSAIVIPVGYDNIHMYGNGVKITGYVYDENYDFSYSILDSRCSNCILDGFVVYNTSYEGCGLYNTGANCTITGNTFSGCGNYGLYNTGANCTITGNTCSSDENSGLFCGASDTVNKCIIIGNVSITGGISVKEGTCLPATQEAMADVNTGTITLRSEEV